MNSTPEPKAPDAWLIPRNATPRVRELFDCAVREAFSLREAKLRPEHLLLGLLRLSERLGECTASQALRNVGVDHESLKNIYETTLGVKLPKVVSTTPYAVVCVTTSWSVIRIMRRARKEARKLKHGVIGTEHILLALLARKNGGVVQMLKTANADIEILKAELIKALSRRIPLDD